MARVYKRGGVWWMDFERSGVRTRKSLDVPTGAITKSQAKDLMNERIAQKAKDEVFGARPEPVTFARFAEEWLDKDSPDKKSKDRDRDIVVMLTHAWRGQDLHTVTTEMIEGYSAKRRKRRAPATVNREIQVIKRLFKKAHAWGRITTNPAANVEKFRVNNARVRFLEPDELTRLREHTPEWLRPIVTFARFSGARRGEILGLAWRDVDFKRGLITFRDTKNGEDGTIEMNGTVRSLLESIPRALDRGAKVFPGIKIMRLRRAWERALRRARIGESCDCNMRTEGGKWDKKCGRCEGTGIVPDFHFHDLRHQAATDLLTLGADLNDVRDFLRHKTMNMTLRYAHLVRARRSRTANLLDSLASQVVQNPAQSGAPSA